MNEKLRRIARRLIGLITNKVFMGFNKAEQISKRVKDTVSEAVKDASVIGTKGENDTLRLWESYKDQALLWRALTLLQIPTTLAALIFSIILWNNRHITLNVPREPLPGVYSAKELPDEKFIEAATEVVNLIATYTSATARPQFKRAREFLNGTLLEHFDEEQLGAELRAIEDTNKTQIFFVDPTKTATLRVSNTEVKVQLEGSRLKIVGGKELPLFPTRYILTLTTLPRNVLNPYGIVVSNIQFETIAPENS